MIKKKKCTVKTNKKATTTKSKQMDNNYNKCTVQKKKKKKQNRCSLFSFFLRSPVCSWRVRCIRPSPSSVASHLLHGKNCSMPAIGQYTVTLSRNQPDAAPVLSWPISMWESGESMVSTSTLKMSVIFRSNFPVSNQILPLVSLPFSPPWRTM